MVLKDDSSGPPISNLNHSKAPTEFNLIVYSVSGDFAVIINGCDGSMFVCFMSVNVRRCGERWSTNAIVAGTASGSRVTSESGVNVWFALLKWTIQISWEFVLKIVLFKSTHGVRGIECSCLMDTSWSITGCGCRANATTRITSVSVVTVVGVVLVQLGVSPWVDQILLLFVQAIKYVIVDSISVWTTIGYG